MTSTRERQAGDAVPAGHRSLHPDPTTGATADQAGRSRSGAWRAFLGFRNISAVYVFVVLFIVFAMWVPETFLASTTWRTPLDNGSVTALLAVGLVLRLASGVFDLALGVLVAVAGAKYQRSPGRLSAVRKTLRMGRESESAA